MLGTHIQQSGSDRMVAEPYAKFRFGDGNSLEKLGTFKVSPFIQVILSVPCYTIVNLH